jgi:hypothetical protein
LKALAPKDSRQTSANPTANGGLSASLWIARFSELWGRSQKTRRNSGREYTDTRQSPAGSDAAEHGPLPCLLSEHFVEGWLEGYILSGRHGLLLELAVQNQKDGSRATPMSSVSIIGTSQTGGGHSDAAHLKDRSHESDATRHLPRKARGDCMESLGPAHRTYRSAVNRSRRAQRPPASRTFEGTEFHKSVNQPIAARGPDL